MKKILLSLLLVTIYVVACNGQPKSNYEIYSNSVPTATKYVFFLEKKSANPYKLVQGMDYMTLGADTSTLKVGTAVIPSFTVNLDNDGSEYKAAIVAVNVNGIYSGMGTVIGTVGTAPTIPSGVGFRKK